MNFRRVVGNYLDLIVAGIDSGLENLHFQLCDLGPAETADELFRFT